MEPENVHSNKHSGDGDTVGPHFEQQDSRLITTEPILLILLFITFIERCLLPTRHSATKILGI